MGFRITLPGSGIAQITATDSVARGEDRGKGHRAVRGGTLLGDQDGAAARPVAEQMIKVPVVGTVDGDDHIIGIGQRVATDSVRRGKDDGKRDIAAGVAVLFKNPDLAGSRAVTEQVVEVAGAFVVEGDDPVGGIEEVAAGRCRRCRSSSPMPCRTWRCRRAAVFFSMTEIHPAPGSVADQMAEVAGAVVVVRDHLVGRVHQVVATDAVATAALKINVVERDVAAGVGDPVENGARAVPGPVADQIVRLGVCQIGIKVECDNPVGFFQQVVIVDPPATLICRGEDADAGPGKNRRRSDRRPRGRHPSGSRSPAVHPQNSPRLPVCSPTVFPLVSRPRSVQCRR